MKESSCLIFHKNSTLRILITTFISKEAWENFIMFLILGNSLIFALDNPLSDQNSLQSQVLDNIDYVLTSIFSLEMALKVISLGFLFNCEKNKKAYIRNSWNQLDCFVVIASILSWAGASNSSLKSLKSLRALRALRSLRMIARNDSLKIVVNAVFQTIPSIGNLSIVAIIINLVVSINTINSWKGAFHYCSLPAGKEELYSKIVTKTNCLENDGLWLNNRRNYDDILSASLSFFLVVVNEDWLPLMYASVDSVGIDMQPIKNYAPYAVFIYYALVIIGTILFKLLINFQITINN